MVQTPAKPVKRRRRWPIVVIAVVLALGMGWCCRPRADQRFVGMWKSYAVKPDGALRLAATLDFAALGYVTQDPDSASPKVMAWLIEHGQLVIDPTWQTNDLPSWLADVWNRLTGQLHPVVVRYDVVSRGTDEIVLRPVAGSGDLVLRRATR